MKPFFKKCYKCTKVIRYMDTPYWHTIKNKKRLCASCISKESMNRPYVKRKLSIAAHNAAQKPAVNRRMCLAQRYRFEREDAWNKGIPMSDAAKTKLSLSRKNKCVGDENPSKRPEVRKKIRLGVIRYIERCKGRCTPRYNPVACRRIDEYGKLHGLTLQHAENGGEFYIKELGYWVDGYDKTHNVVVEYYEPHHNRRALQDEQRKQEIVNHLGCQFIELRAT